MEQRACVGCGCGGVAAREWWACGGCGCGEVAATEWWAFVGCGCGEVGEKLLLFVGCGCDLWGEKWRAFVGCGCGGVAAKWWACVGCGCGTVGEKLLACVGCGCGSVGEKFCAGSTVLPRYAQWRGGHGRLVQDCAAGGGWVDFNDEDPGRSPASGLCVCNTGLDKTAGASTADLAGLPDELTSASTCSGRAGLSAMPAGASTCGGRTVVCLLDRNACPGRVGNREFSDIVCSKH